MHARMHAHYSTHMHTYTHAYTHVDIGMDITHNTLRVAHQLLYTLGLTRACVREQLRAAGKPHGPRVSARSRPCASALRGAIPARLAASLLRLLVEAASYDDVMKTRPPRQQPSILPLIAGVFPQRFF